MSTDTKSKPKADAAVAAEPAAKRKSKLPLLIAVAAVVLAGGGGTAWWSMRSNAGTDKSAAASADAPAAARAPAIYYKFDPAFVVNFGSEGNTRYLQITLEAMSRDAAVVDEIKNNEPAIRNDLVLLFSAQQYDALMTAAGKEKLRDATLEAVRKTIAAEGGKGEAVEGVYFTSFVIQ